MATCRTPGASRTRRCGGSGRRRCAACCARDFNHPAIFSWVLFNETWGLLTQGSDGKKAFLPETQAWVETRVRPRQGARPDAARRGQLALLRRRPREDRPQHAGTCTCPAGSGRPSSTQRDAQTLPGSTWNYLGGRTQRGEPMLNSECGNVWGYEGSHRRRGLELRLPRHDERVPAPPEDRRLALHRAPRRDQRVERLLALRPLGEADGPGRARAGHVACATARALLRRARRLSRERRDAGRDACPCRCGRRS